ncbi:hypothetical protein [Agromyces sp. NBRC 114283]|uniref:hypothetical protein n=1 Tax=Agromyces sp. NBRC 114283 TaxID=2994521 RepID=UPI0024A1C033|nr:hypothetical protein [Agromyces sp. NBRC 114283]GLU88901.1 hypothetical protein Agsp01_11560 [Agromyces sp. NBRC 114283]
MIRTPDEIRADLDALLQTQSAFLVSAANLHRSAHDLEKHAITLGEQIRAVEEELLAANGAAT